jgi:hypothetical protein
MKENEFLRKAGIIYSDPVERDVRGTRPALPSEIMQQIRGRERIAFKSEKFKVLEPFYQPVEEDIKKKDLCQRGLAIYRERMRKKKK